MRFVHGLGLCAVVVGCHGGAREGAVVRPEVGAGGATSLPAARVSYGDAMIMADGPPISLTAGDGTGLELYSLDAHAVVDGPLAFTELHLAFDNPQDRVLEGQFAIRLPENAAISRFAMKIDGQWMEAEMVERQAARRAYEDFLHRKTDPALLEKEAGNEFHARVFPIPAKGRKELIVSYSQELPDADEPYVLPLAGLPRIHDVAATVQVARPGDGAVKWDEITLSERDWQPDRDLAAPGSASTEALGAGGVVALRVTPELPATVERFEAATILVDTSASRAAGFPGYARAIDAMVAAMAAAQPKLEIVVAAFDQGVAEIYRGSASAAGGQLESALLGRMPLGASDLGAALGWAKGEGKGRVIVISDGVATAGELDAAKLGALVAGVGAERLDVVLAGGIRDRATAEAMTRGRLARDGAILDLDDGADEVARRLALETRSDLAIAVKGASAVWPTELDGVQPGDAAMVYAWFDGAAPAKVTLTVGTSRRTLDVESAAAPLVERAAAQAEVARLEASVGDADAKARGAIIDRIVALSTSQRVLSSYTALLVLETEADYARFGIDRKALAGILVVGRDGVEVQQRRDVAVIATDVLVKEPEYDNEDGKEKDKKEAEKLVTLEQAGEPGSYEGEDDEDAPKPARAVDQEPRDARPPPSPEPESSVSSGSSGSVSGQMSLRQDRDSGGDSMAEDEERDDSADFTGPPPLAGRLLTVMDLLAAGRKDAALDEALDWRGDDPGDVLALIALGETFERSAQTALAARAYGSIIDLFPARADLRRFAGARLDRLEGLDAATLALDTFQRAVEERPDHLTGHRMLAFALVRAGRLGEAFAALERGIAQPYPADRFRGGDRVLREDLGLVAAAWLHAEPKQKSEIRRRLRASGAELDTGRSIRFVLSWETDANDVDFHIRDAKKGHAFFRQPTLRSGGELYADVTTGYGPECFTIRGTPKAAPYQLGIHYYSRGPMGYGMGKLEIIRHDGKGTLRFEQRPFIVMNDAAYVDLGTVE